MPKLTELADYVLELVAEELDVTKESIMSKSRKTGAKHLTALCGASG